MHLMQDGLYELILTEHEQRVRRSELRRRAYEARAELRRYAAAPSERRFSLFRFRLPVFRLRQT